MKAEVSSPFCKFSIASPIVQYAPKLLERMHVWGHFVVYYMPAFEVLTCFIVGLSIILANNEILK